MKRGRFSGEQIIAILKLLPLFLTTVPLHIGHAGCSFRPSLERESCKGISQLTHPNGLPL